jgi:hypothetical protein
VVLATKPTAPAPAATILAASTMRSISLTWLATSFTTPALM